MMLAIKPRLGKSSWRPAFRRTARGWSGRPTVVGLRPATGTTRHLVQSTITAGPRYYCSWVLPLGTLVLVLLKTLAPGCITPSRSQTAWLLGLQFVQGPIILQGLKGLRKGACSSSVTCSRQLVGAVMIWQSRRPRDDQAWCQWLAWWLSCLNHPGITKMLYVSR